MSTDYSLRILTRVSTRLADLDEVGLATMLARALDPLPGVHPLTRMGTLPRFGAGLSYDDRRFRDLSGVAVRDGMLIVGVGCQNAQDSYREVDDDLPYGAEVETRLDRVLARISAISEGPAGEVVGSVSDENDFMFASDGGRPIVRCRDGVLRRALVPDDEDVRACLYGPGDDEPPRVPLPEVIPPDTIVPVEGVNLEADLDLAALRVRFAAIDPDPTPRSLAGPGR